MSVPPDEPPRSTDRASGASESRRDGPSESTTRVGSRGPRPVPPPAAPAAAPAVPGYEVQGEIARGGMGVVLAARETALDRAVAVKTLRPDRPADARSFRRFVTEARITARLQHPGVPPVHHVGQLPDGRPYLVMKLIAGRTLAELLEARAPAAPDLPRFVQVFEQICQTVGFAHSQGVIHRDLKPQNVMVGAFGEVQVMDWGLAKSGVRGAGEEAGVETVDFVPGEDATDAPDGPAPLTRFGSAMGTPAYMAPEQARGEWDRVDARADVFALGGILADVLTGRPPFVAATAGDTLKLAAAGNLAEAFLRLDRCGADAELVALAKRCLRPKPGDRPADAKAVADAVAGYRAGVEARLRKAETERAAAAARAEEAKRRAAAEEAAKQAAEARAAAEERAKVAAEARAAAETRARREAQDRADEAARRVRAEQAKAVEQRKRRRVQLWLAAAVALLLAGAGAFGWWQDRQAQRASLQQAELDRAEAERKLAVQQARAGADSALRQAVELRRRLRFREAAESLGQAESLAGSGAADDLKPVIQREKADLAFARELDEVRARKWQWVSHPDGASGHFDTASAPPAYRAAFAARGLDPAAGSPDAVAERVAKSPIARDLVRALDDWSLDEPDAALAAKVLEVARRADPGEWSDQVRDPAVRADRLRLAALAAKLDDATASAPAALALAELLERRRLDPGRLLAVAYARHPGDFDLAFALALGHHMRDTRRLTREARALNAERAVGYYRAARAIRPDHAATLTNLGLLLGEANQTDAAVAVLRDAVRIHPDDHIAHFNLGSALLQQKKPAEAEAAYRATIKLRPNYAAAHSNLGAVLGEFGDRAGAAVALREAVRLAPDDPLIRCNYGLSIQRLGNVDGALAEYRKAIELDKQYAPGYFNLGAALEIKKDNAAAVAAFREAARLDPEQYGHLLKKLPPEK